MGRSDLHNIPNSIPIEGYGAYFSLSDSSIPPAFGVDHRPIYTPSPSLSGFLDHSKSFLSSSFSSDNPLSAASLHDIIRFVYSSLYSDQVIRLDLCKIDDPSTDTFRRGLLDHISSGSSKTFSSLVQVCDNHWVTVSVTKEGSSSYHAYYANSVDDPIQDSIIGSVLIDSGISQVHKLSVSLQGDTDSSGLYALYYSNSIVKSIDSGQTQSLIRDGLSITPVKIASLHKEWSSYLDPSLSSSFSQDGSYIGRNISFSGSRLYRCDVNRLRVHMSSFSSVSFPSSYSPPPIEASSVVGSLDASRSDDRQTDSISSSFSASKNNTLVDEEPCSSVVYDHEFNHLDAPYKALGSLSLADFIARDASFPSSHIDLITGIKDNMDYIGSRTLKGVDSHGQPTWFYVDSGFIGLGSSYTHKPREEYGCFQGMAEQQQDHFKEDRIAINKIRNMHKETESLETERKNIAEQLLRKEESFKFDYENKRSEPDSELNIFVSDVSEIAKQKIDLKLQSKFPSGEATSIEKKLLASSSLCQKVFLDRPSKLSITNSTLVFHRPTSSHSYSTLNSLSKDRHHKAALNRNRSHPSRHNSTVCAYDSSPLLDQTPNCVDTILVPSQSKATSRNIVPSKGQFVLDLPYSFTKDKYYKVDLRINGDNLDAVVYDNRFPGVSSKYSASVALSRGLSLDDVINQDPAYWSNHSDLFLKNDGTSVVYMGSGGLKGGSLFNWFGYKSCTWAFCFNDVWSCDCSYKCQDDSCWKHCNKHKESHPCPNCRRPDSCPISHSCAICREKKKCFNCCGCTEREKQSAIRAKKLAEKRSAEEKERRNQELRDYWEQEQESIRQQEEIERQESIRQQEAQEERERQERIRCSS